MLVSKDNFEKLSCVEAFISMVAFGGGTHSWTLPISFFGIYAVQKDNRNMMFPSIIFHLFGILLDILVLIFGVGTFAAVFMVINIILKLVLRSQKLQLPLMIYLVLILQFQYYNLDY